MLKTNAPERRRQASPIVILALGLVSGALTLGYEVLWTRELLNLLGSTTRASALVLAGFMGGLALGAYAAGRWTVGTGRPLRLFAAAEGGLGCIGLVLPHALHYAASRIGISAILDATLLALLFVPAFLMGIALPALAAALQHQGATQPKYVAALYGLNALGGATAALGVGLMALPTLGLFASERAVAAAGLLLAALAWAMSARTRPFLPIEETNADTSASDIPSVPIARATMLGAVILAGVAALGYEVLWTRILVLVVGSSSTAFALMLGFYLLGLALGGFAISRFPAWEVRPARAFQVLQLAIAAAALLSAGAYAWLPSVALLGFAQLGTTPASILVVNVLCIAAIILPPTVFIGASFPVAARLMERNRPQRGREVGLALALTTAGNVGGILLAAFAIVPAAGLQGGVAVLAALNALAALVLWLVGRPRHVRRRYAIPTAVFALGLVTVALPPWDIAVMTSGVFRQAPVYLALLGSAGGFERAFSEYETRYYREGSEAVVAVFDRPTLEGTPHRVLTIDGKVDASTGADMATQVLSGHLPFLFRPEAKEVLVIGLASGVTVGALAKHPVERIEVVEIESAVVAASHTFDGVSGAPLADPRVQVTIADGRRYLAQRGGGFDIIVSEPSNPWLSMSARLFTREFFALVRERLRPNGVLVQWVPLYGLNRSQFQALLRTLLDIFPEVALFQVAEGDLVAVAGQGSLTLEPDAIIDLFSRDGISSQLQAIGLERPVDLLAQWTAEGRALRTALDDGPLNTDDNGLVEFGSPWYLLADTKADNQAFIAQTEAHTSVPTRIGEVLLPLSDGRKALDALARHYLDRRRLAMLRALAGYLRSIGEVQLSDLYAGDSLAAEGRWSEAEALWAQHEAPPFWSRLAWASFRSGDAEATARLFAKAPEAQRSPLDDIAFGLALAKTGRPEEALEVLSPRRSARNTLSSILAPFVRFAVLEQIAGPETARAALRKFEHGLDGLRRCLETEKCQGVVDDLLRWSEGGNPGLNPPDVETLRQAVFLRITRPLPHYFEAVRNLWLGDQEAAARAFRTYLNLLPEPDPLSKSHEFLARVDTRVAGNPDAP